MRNDLEISHRLPFVGEPHKGGTLHHKGLYLKAPPQGSQNSGGPLLTGSPHPLLNPVSSQSTDCKAGVQAPWALAPREGRCLQESHQVDGWGRSSLEERASSSVVSSPFLVTQPKLLPPTPSLPTELQTASASIGTKLQEPEPTLPEAEHYKLHLTPTTSWEKSELNSVPIHGHKILFLTLPNLFTQDKTYLGPH